MKPNSGFGIVDLGKIGANLALQALMELYAHRGIRVNAVAPGATWRIGPRAANASGRPVANDPNTLRRKR